MAERHTGIIRRFDTSRGFGFITPGGDDNIFVHVSQFADKLAAREGVKVEFDVSEDKFGRGQRAWNIEVCSDAV